MGHGFCVHIKENISGRVNWGILVRTWASKFVGWRDQAIGTEFSVALTKKFTCPGHELSLNSTEWVSQSLYPILNAYLNPSRRLVDFSHSFTHDCVTSRLFRLPMSVKAVTNPTDVPLEKSARNKTESNLRSQTCRERQQPSLVFAMPNPGL